MSSQLQKNIFNILFLFYALLICGCASGSLPDKASTPVAQPPQVDTETSVIPESHERLPVEKISLGAGDEIEVLVWKHDDLTRSYRIDVTEKIFFPMVGNIDVRGMDAAALRERISNGLSNYINDPQVNVTVLRQRNRKVYVMGEVQRPGVLTIEDEINVLDALLLVGGMTRDADPAKVIVISNGSESLKLRLVNFDQLLEGDGSQMIQLSKNDIIYVPPSFIANVDRFFEHVGKIFSPIVDFERSIKLAHDISELFQGNVGTSEIIIYR